MKDNISKEIYEALNYSFSLSEEKDFKINIYESKFYEKQGNIYVYYNYDLYTTKDGNEIVRAKGVPIVLTTKIENNQILILDKQEYLNEGDIPKYFK